MERIQNIIIGLGYLGVFGAVFAESGIFLGAFLPGDSLLFTVGLLASQGFFNIAILIPVAALMAIVGDNVGYHFGRAVGPKIFTREDSLLFRKSYVVKTKAFYERYGRKTIILARFVPIVRTFAPILAGVGKMDYRTFFIFNVIGGIAWTAGMLGAGFLLGNFVPGIDRYLEWIILGIIFLSVLPMVFEWLRSRRD
ncbi:MAG: VTT domain-containing protein [Candidatus Magasanikbacteria bacterium]|nr:VTT domain-containing protein [Candidatus Magasanikbacteria bacterium]